MVNRPFDMNTTYVLYCGALITLAEYKAIIAEQ
nr:MAG TPA: hypothetical protein [Caudoviricetes sp.]DAQ75766.1 MAG TPA: hypothetical protein [Caudoviricetes sp.]